MNRIERPPLVIYVDRDRLGSFLCLWSFCLVAPIAWAARRALILSSALLLGAAALLLGAFYLLFRARAIVIDRAQGELRILDRAMPWGSAHRTQMLLHELSVWMLARPDARGGPPTYVVCVSRGTDPAVVLRRGRSLDGLRAWAEGFAADLGHPLFRGPGVDAAPGHGSGSGT